MSLQETNVFMDNIQEKHVHDAEELLSKIFLFLQFVVMQKRFSILPVC